MNQVSYELQTKLRLRKSTMPYQIGNTERIIEPQIMTLW